jgi:hypothetical protein
MGVRVQAWFADEISENGNDVYDSVTCTACRNVHLVNPTTGRVLGADDDE